MSKSGPSGRPTGKAPPIAPESSRAQGSPLTSEELQSLLDCIEIPMVLLDEDLRVRIFARSAADLFEVHPDDFGPSIAEVASCLATPLIEDDLRQVMRSQAGLEREVDAAGERSYVLRALPYRSREGRTRGVVLTFTDITERRRKEQQQHLLVAELGHRIKNTLTVVQSIAAQTMRRSVSLEAFYRQFSQRLQALSRAHDLLSAGNWHQAQLREVVAETLKPHDTAPGRIRLEGEEIKLEAGAALTLSLAFHELTTNAVKHGALSTPSGNLSVEWSMTRVERAPALRLVWRETGGPGAGAPAQHGFGLTLIERSIGHELDGTVRLDFAPEGLTCEIVVPCNPTNVHLRSQAAAVSLDATDGS
jgi:two-component system CheB/CheR fusion protein